MVIEWHFGTGTEPQARVELVVPVDEDVVKLTAAAAALADRGARISKRAVMERANLPEAEDDEDVLGGGGNRPDAKVKMVGSEFAMNADVPQGLQDLRQALAAGLHPICAAMWAAYAAGDMPAVRAGLTKFRQMRPDDGPLADALTREFAGAFSEGGIEA